MLINLTKPLAGWASLVIDDDENHFHGALSYVQDVPMMFLSQFNRYIMGDDVVFNFDEEGTNFILILCQYDTVKIIAERQTSELYDLHIWSDEFIEPICKSILHNLNDWAEFNALTTDEYKENRQWILDNVKPILEWCKERKE